MTWTGRRATWLTMHSQLAKERVTASEDTLSPGRRVGRHRDALD